MRDLAPFNRVPVLPRPRDERAWLPKWTFRFQGRGMSPGYAATSAAPSKPPAPARVIGTVHLW